MEHILPPALAFRTSSSITRAPGDEPDFPMALIGFPNRVITPAVFLASPSSTLARDVPRDVTSWSFEKIPDYSQRKQNQKPFPCFRPDSGSISHPQALAPSIGGCDWALVLPCRMAICPSTFAPRFFSPVSILSISPAICRRIEISCDSNVGR